jgi:hypothetical protein
MDRRRTMRRLQAIAVGLALTWAASASAEPGYIDYLDSALDVDASSSPTDCTPCHQPGGGTAENSNLQPFGALLHQDGIGEPSSSEAAFAEVLDQIKQDQPKVYADLQAGRDPNPDVSTTGVHVPEYGCDVTTGPPVREQWWIAAFGGVWFAVVVRRRRAARSSLSS